MSRSIVDPIRKDRRMKLRSLFLVAAGIGIGYSFSQRMRQDDPEVVRGPQSRSSASPALQLATHQAQRLADQASVRSLDVIRRARGAIRGRLGETETFDEAAWN